MKNIVTITLNPALDLTGTLDRLNQGSVSLVNESAFHAAGKGVNVARVLKELGANVTVTGFLGKDNQEMFCQLFDHIDVNDQFIRVEGATRINVKLVEHDKSVSDINFPGVAVTEEDKHRFENTLLELAKSHDLFVLAGSLPRGVTPLECANWIEMLTKLGKKVVFDSSREALVHGIQSSPWLIKPNEEELGYLVNQPLSSVEACINAAAALDDLIAESQPAKSSLPIQDSLPTENIASIERAKPVESSKPIESAKPIENLVISLGADGVLWRRDDYWLHSTPPKVDIVSTVGAGDTLVAGMCWGHLNQWDDEQTLSFATALSALAVSQVGVGVPDLNTVTSLQHNITIKRISKL
ncbi:hexose kinase [Vibrio penaeicida]|uniref:Phosphofructokinase n=1 Tax=Vibrio penaeicida TaxID=104609 RepID=A0AAV5NQ40_9VIBR|nr:hexose kinase [Vibrio penaeicida]RTZ21191.1 1-phosphofructokinase [Vibrio penaeicida]GLQ72558.1 phosphofructokinase [Vibrio penaeicida]